MRAMLLFYGRSYTGTGAPPAPEAFRKLVDGHLSYERDVLLPQVDVILGQALAPAAVARTLTFNEGGTEVADGPAVVTEEALGGFYVIECSSLNEAEALAARYPMAPGFGRIEVRPILAFDPALRDQVHAPHHRASADS